VLEALKRVLDSRTFSTAPHMAKLLRFCVEQTLAGNRQSQHGIAIALGYAEFDAVQDSNVRREIGRLRNKLRDYYDQEGADPVIISIPKASAKDGYSAEFKLRQQQIAAESQNPRYIQLTCEARHLRGQRMPDPTTEAIRLYEEAIREDPDHSASAQAGLSECYCFLALWGFRPHDTMPRVKEWALKAISANPGSAAAHAALAFATTAYDWNWPLGEQLFQKALALAPQSIEVRCWYASHLICVGRFPEAIKQARKAQTLEHDPSAVVLSHVAKILYVAGDLDHAFDLLQLTLQINPRFYFSHWYLGLLLLDRGDVDVGLEHLRRAAALAPESTGVLASLGYALAVLEHRQEAARCLQTLNAMRECHYVPSTDLATIYAGLGETEAALNALEQAFVEKCLFLTWLHAWPPYKPLRGEPRFAGILERLGLSGGDLRQLVQQRP
jgi:tetratricopeptide (TPR) repeat protein